MHEWPVIDSYARYHPRWFESPARHQPSEEHRVAFIEEMPSGWPLERDGLWYVAHLPDVKLPDQGWKLHVSVRSADSLSCLRRALPVLRDERAAFKFLLDPEAVCSVNGKLWPRGSSGKFITVYPHSEAQFQRLGSQLAKALQGFAGPYILSDRRWPESHCVHYRYGGFRARTQLQVNGTSALMISSPEGELVPDVRQPYWDPPAWATDPFGEETTIPSAGLTLDNGAFTVTAAVSFSNRGGVYRGLDNGTGREVILKEARPEVEIGRHRVEAISALEKEYRLLTKLRGTRYFVNPVKFFRDQGHAFLVEDYLPGDLLGHYTIRHNPLYHDNVTPSAAGGYLRDLRAIWLQLARAVAAAHALGIVLADLSFGNVVVTEGSEIKMFDLECAVEEGVDPQVGMYTPGFATEASLRTGTSDRANDYHALGALIFGSLMLANGVAELHPPARGRFLNELADDLALPQELIALVDELTAPEAEPDPDSVIRAIEGLPVGIDARVPRLGTPVERRLDRAGRDSLRKRVIETRAAAVSYIEGTADPSRSDRLFPGDLSVFQTNPLSVAFGAAGVLYALDRITGEVPAKHLEWLLGHAVERDEYPPGLYVGQAGIAWVLGELGYPDVAVRIMRSARRHELLWQSPDVLYGASGYGLTCLRLWAGGHGEEFLEDAVGVGDRLTASALRDERGAHWPEDGGEVPLGYGYGGSGIALLLLYLHLATGDTGVLERGREALDFELLHGFRNGGRFAGFPALVLDDPAVVHAVPRCYWDAGSAGVATTLVRYLAVTGDPILGEHLAEVASDLVHKYAVLPQLFHGSAGLGNALLDIWEHTADERFLSEAWQIAEGVLLFGIERPEGIGFPGEQAIRESADFATGAAGINLFLDRLVKADEGIHGNFNFVVDELLPGGSLRGFSDAG